MCNRVLSSLNLYRPDIFYRSASHEIWQLVLNKDRHRKHRMQYSIRETARIGLRAFSARNQHKPVATTWVKNNHYLITTLIDVVKKLFAVRWMGQFTDGLFQSALASFVLFSPERQPSAQTAALAFSVVLLPYSLIGPFVGTLLDRFSRQRIVFGSNLFRAITLIFIATLISNGVTGVELTIFVLVAFGVNRLILAGLSAGLPLLIDKKQLISYMRSLKI